MDITEDLASVCAVPGRGQEVGMTHLLAFKSARPSQFVLGSPSRRCQPCHPVPAPVTWDGCGKTTAQPQSHRLLSRLSQLSLLILQRRYAESDGAYHVCMGRERLLGFKEQIKPSKRLSALNTAYSHSRPEHHLSSDSSLSSASTEDSFTAFTARHCCQLAESAQP